MLFFYYFLIIVFFIFLQCFLIFALFRIKLKNKFFCKIFDCDWAAVRIEKEYNQISSLEFICCRCGITISEIEEQKKKVEKEKIKNLSIIFNKKLTPYDNY